MSSFRIKAGGLIERSKPLKFTFDGKSYTGFASDTLASALLANGVRIMGRSFKYHRPRGPWSAWSDDPNAIMNVTLAGNELNNCAATTTLLEDGMQARAVNAYPSAQFDMKGALDRFHRLLPAGFYYKMFMWPDWHLYEPLIRKMAGLGALDGREIDGFVSDQTHDDCELLVVGAGPAGLMAARTAAEAGKSVVLVDDHAEAGGTAFQHATIDGQAPRDWVQGMLAAIKAAGGRVLPSTTAFGVYDHQLVGLAQARAFGQAPRLIRMRAKRCIVATGAIDRPVTFANNDRPGVMSLSGAAEFLARYGVLAGRDIAVIAPHALAKTQAEALSAAGANVTLLDTVQGTAEALGGKRLRGLSANGATHSCDTILTSAGLMPLVHLWRHAGGKLAWDEAMACFVPAAGPNWMQAIGAANGTFALKDALAEAQSKDSPRQFAYTATPPLPETGSNKRQWIDLQHDVTLKDIELAARENYASVEHLKRYTTLGMASDQGKSSNVAGLSALAAIKGKSVPEVGTTTFRPPFVPVPFELYRGVRRAQQFAPIKRLALEAAHREAEAALGEYGGWLRPGWYGAGSGHDAAQREAKLARETAGIFDASPLGKIEVMGPDAAAFVNFIYYNTISTLKVGHIRYGFMLTEAGHIYDDGVIARLGDNRFVISCSSSHVDGVNAQLEAWRQDGNDPDRIFVHDTTQHWATVTVTGPKARDIVSAVDLGSDISREALPHMRFTNGTFDGTQVRIARVSFTGDMSFELSIAAAHACALWQACVAAGAEHGAAPIGLEALSILRAEKGYLIIGKDTDGETMPQDLGFTTPRLKKRAAFVGDRGLHTPEANAANRKLLVGLSVPEGANALPTGAHVVEGKRSRGFVSSSYISPTLGKPIALALVAADLAVKGNTVQLFHLGHTLTAKVVSPCFVDPEGERLNA